MTPSATTNEGRKSLFAAFVAAPLYRLIPAKGIRTLLRRLILKLEGGPMYTLTVRSLYRRCHGIEVGLYTIGPCEAGPDLLEPGTVIGRYCSIYYTVRTMCHDELADMKNPRVLYFASALGKASPDASAPPKLVIGNDVFIGHNAVVLPHVGEIGDGAFIGAGAIVQKPVPPYAIVMGNPARVVRYRFPEHVIERELESKWWLRRVDDLAANLEEFRKPLDSGH